MSEFMNITFMVILGVEFIIGNVGNGFIALMNCVDWVKRRKICPVDQILTPLAFSRISLFWTASIYILSNFYPGLLTETMRKITSIIWMVTGHFNIWLATCLNIFYFFKIGNFSKSIFLFLKRRVKEITLFTFLVSLIFLPLHVILANPHLNVWVNRDKWNTSYSSNWINSTRLLRKVFFHNYTLTVLPLTVSLTTFLLLVLSLWKHLKRMQHISGSRDASTTAHIQALQTVSAFLLLYITVLQMSSYELLEKRFIFLFHQVTAFGFLSGHPCVLILGNKKLRKTFFFIAAVAEVLVPKCGTLSFSVSFGEHHIFAKEK